MRVIATLLVPWHSRVGMQTISWRTSLEIEHSEVNGKRAGIFNSQREECVMKPRLNAMKVAPEALKPMLGLENYVQTSGLERSLMNLVKLRASQINGCAYCIDMHTHEARQDGESEQRLYLLSAWRESPLYSERERAALEWTEALTLISHDHARDEAYELARSQFSEVELVNLSMLIVTINGWNRLAIGFRNVHPVRSQAA
jgi:AhpD family alkylhydroperoxidase